MVSLTILGSIGSWQRRNTGGLSTAHWDKDKLWHQQVHTTAQHSWVLATSLTSYYGNSVNLCFFICKYGEMILCQKLLAHRIDPTQKVLSHFLFSPLSSSFYRRCSRTHPTQAINVWETVSSKINHAKCESLQSYPTRGSFHFQREIPEDNA